MQATGLWLQEAVAGGVWGFLVLRVLVGRGTRRQSAVATGRVRCSRLALQFTRRGGRRLEFLALRVLANPETRRQSAVAADMR
jgi:hypothetical protein